MDTDRKLTLFSVFAFGLIGFCFLLLLQEVVLSGELWAEIPRVFAGLVAPVPVALFLGFVFVGKSLEKPVEPKPALMTGLLAGTILATVAIGLLFRGAGETGELGIGPVIAQAAVFSSSLINLLFAKSPLVASLLSGVSIGLTVFVIFLT